MGKREVRVWETTLADTRGQQMTLVEICEAMGVEPGGKLRIITRKGAGRDPMEVVTDVTVVRKVKS